MYEKPTTIDSKRVGKQTLQKKKKVDDLYDATLGSIRLFAHLAC